MFDWLIEFAASIVLATVLVYFVFLTPPPPSNAVRPRAQRRGAAAVSAQDGCKWNADMDTTQWVEVCVSWVASMRLGGWTYDGRMWSDRIAATVDNGLHSICRLQQTARHLTANVPLIRIDSLTLGFDDDTNEGGEGAVELDRQHARAALPMLTGVSSRAYASTGLSTSRELVFHLSFIDGHFHLQSYCELPILFGLPPSLLIPPDVLTLKCRVDVSDVLFQSSVCVRMVSGSRIEVFFTTIPLFEARIRTCAPSASNSRRGGPHHTMEAKGGEMLGNAIRAAMQTLVFPDVLVLTIRREAPRLQWEKEKLDAASV